MKKFLAVLAIVGLTSVAFGADQWYVKSNTNWTANALVSSTNKLVQVSNPATGLTLTSLTLTSTNASFAVNVYAVNATSGTNLVAIVNAGGSYSPVHTYPDISGTTYYVRATSNAAPIQVNEQDGGGSGTSPTFLP